MKLWLATTLAAMLLSVCTAYPYYAEADVTPDANMQQMDDTTAGMVEYYRPFSTPDRTPDVNVEKFLDTRVMALPPDRAPIPLIIGPACLKYLYILAFTSGKKHAGTDHGHAVEVRAAGQTKVLKLPNRPGDDYQKYKGDLWKLDFYADLKFDSTRSRCVTLANLDRITIKAASNDGWNIDSIVTYVGDDKGTFADATVDFNVFRWIDGNGQSSARSFILTNVRYH